MLNPSENTYLELLEDIFNTGKKRSDRTSTGTYSKFGGQYIYDISKSIPVLTTKKIHWKSVVGELLWMLSGSTNAKELENKYGVTIWKEWMKENGDLGKIYGYQWIYWSAVDRISNESYPINQISNLIHRIKIDPYSRRHVVTAWNPGDIHQSVLSPCHCFMQFYVNEDNTLDCQLYQRSADVFLGVPFNIASYSLLTYMVAQVTGYKPGRFIHTLGDAHIYANHLGAVHEQLSRPLIYEAPTLKLNPDIKNIFDFTPADIELVGYKSHPTIKAEVSV